MRLAARVRRSFAALPGRGAAAARRVAVAARRGAAAAHRAVRLRACARGRRRGAPSLVHHILSVQLAVTAAIGVLALLSLAWTSQTIIENNLAHWAEQWTEQLNELGAPLYLSDQDDALINVETFVETYPELAYVNWYGRDGRLLFTIGSDEPQPGDRAALGAETTEALGALAGRSMPHVLDERGDSPGLFRLRGPIWTESFVGDGLAGFRAGGSAQTTLEVLGFVELELDFSWYYDQLFYKLMAGSVVLLGVLALSWRAGRYWLMRALEPLSALQEPLAELARGNMRVRFAPSRHREIQSIVATLEETTAALEQRDGRLLHLATHDPLTGLQNRHRFVEHLTAELDGASTDVQSAVFFIDLDQFKYINDTCGHPAGDELLRLAARCIEGAVRAHDTVARFGGDEFTVLARSVDRHEAREIGRGVLEQMRMLTQIHGDKVFHLQCSVGIAMARAGELDAHEYLAQADMACHAAKSKGRNRLEMYRLSDRDNQQMAKDIRWVQTVRRALEHGSFVMLYQPLVDLQTGWADHYEVLLRLQTENGQLVPPDAFLPAAARFGLLAQIDRWVLENAIAALAGFLVSRPDLRFSINLSASVLEDDRLAAYVQSLLSEKRVPPGAVVFEITEQVAVRFAARVDRQLASLRELGCGFAIDDFGKGYSSFSYLKQLPVDYMKIDGSFIDRLDRDRIDQTLVRMLAELGRATGISTVAERVQNAATLDILAKFGIDYAQGYYLGRPARAPEAKQFAVPAGSRRKFARRA